MKQHEALSQLKFKRNSKGIAFKFEYVYGLGETSKVAIGYSEVDIKGAGKVLARIGYDGSLTESSVVEKIGDTWDYYLSMSDYNPQCQNSWRLGFWLVIPNNDITAERPIDFWINVARYDFLHHVDSSIKNHHSTEEVEALNKAINEAEIKAMTVPEWNAARLAMYPEFKQSYYTTK